MDVWSARLYGQFSLDKTLTLQAGATVLIFMPFDERIASQFSSTGQDVKKICIWEPLGTSYKECTRHRRVHIKAVRRRRVNQGCTRHRRACAPPTRRAYRGCNSHFAALQRQVRERLPSPSIDLSRPLGMIWVRSHDSWLLTCYRDFQEVRVNSHQAMPQVTDDSSHQLQDDPYWSKIHWV